MFGLATVGFTVGSVGAAFLYRLAPAPVLVLASAVVAAGGVALAATAHGLPQLLLGYGVVFGTGGGVGYILLQQGVNMLVRRRRGLVNGYIVSLYPMGAMIATPAFHACNEAYGWRATLGRAGGGAAGRRHRRRAACAGSVGRGWSCRRRGGGGVRRRATPAGDPGPDLPQSSRRRSSSPPRRG